MKATKTHACFSQLLLGFDFDGLAKKQCGAGGRTRTDTTFYGPRILSPVRLPFRHTGKVGLEFRPQSKSRRVPTGWQNTSGAAVRASEVSCAAELRGAADDAER